MRLYSLAVLLSVPLCAQVKFTRGQDRISIEIDGKPYTAFFLSPDGNKPYVYPLSTASGVVVTRHFPMEDVPGETHDHPHHRGLFFGHGDVNGYNFWATEPNINTPKKGSMRLKKAAESKDGAKSGTIAAVFDGLSPEGRPIMTETRTITFYSDPKLRTIDYEIRIDPVEKLTFGDTKEGTFGLRLATPLSEARTGRMVNAEAEETEKKVWGKRSPWVDYYGQVDGQTVGVAILDHPSNPRHPTYWHSRAYGLFAANIFGVRDFTDDKTQDGSMTLEKGQKLTFHYRVIIHPGDARSAGIAGLYQKYAAAK